jgi:uncharacterized protein DUF5666
VNFTVDGTTIATDESTDYKKAECGDLRNGEPVSGHGTAQRNGTVLAAEIKVKKHDH